MSVECAALECHVLEPSNRQVSAAGYERGLLWRIKTPNGEISHIYGTMHISDPRVVNLPNVVTRAFDEAQTFVMEVLLDTEAVSHLGAAMYYTDETRLHHVIEPDLFERASQLLEDYGVSRRAAALLKPWAAYTTLSLPPTQRAALPLDLMLLLQASSMSKPAHGLETIDEQIAIFNELGSDDQADLLRTAVCHYQLFQTVLETMIEQYAAGDLAALLTTSFEYQSPAQDRFMDILLWQRNQRMVDRMLQYLDKGGAFIAIGALHLPAKEGVLSLLQQRGYDVSVAH